VNTSITEVPYIEVKPHALPDDPTKGYIVVVVPASPRAPHQVTVKGEYRFYGRGATGNRLLNEGEIARLYARRERYEAAGINFSRRPSPTRLTPPLRITATSMRSRTPWRGT
jgi:hypothetical protein